MYRGRTLLCLLFWIISGSCVIGQSTEALLAARGLIHSSDPQAKIEYCGAISTRKVDYFLFFLEQRELSGTVLIQQRAGTAPVIIDADTSLFPFCDDSECSVEKRVQDAIEVLLRRRKFSKKSRALLGSSRRDLEVSAVGREIDRVIYPISGFRLGSNSTHEILRVLRTGPTVAVDPRTAPPGAIIVSPTQYSPYGPINLGHAGIVGLDNSIYSADARYGGARTKNFSLTSWFRQFSGTNGSYAFVLHAASGENVREH
jgi:hypothetical protein